MPGNVAIQYIELAFCLLDAVLTDIRDTGVDGLTHGCDIVVLRDGHKLDGCILRHTRPPRHSGFDFCFYLLESFCDHEKSPIPQMISLV